MLRLSWEGAFEGCGGCACKDMNVTVRQASKQFPWRDDRT